ncbi:cystatin-F [Epinephelus lanceolatus]
MMGPKTLLLVSLLTVLAVTSAEGSQDGGPMVGTWRDISTMDLGPLQAVDSAVSFYNNMSNDIFLFKPLSITRAQMKVVEGALYAVDLDMTRTVCRKRDNNRDLSNCDVQPEGDDLHQTFQCHTEVWVIPWENKTMVRQFTCSS